MAKYEVRVRYAFEGTYMVAAGNREEAKRMVEEDCGLVLGGNIHTTRDDDEVTDWNFGIHPESQILSIKETGRKARAKYIAMNFSDRNYVMASLKRYGSCFRRTHWRNLPLRTGKMTRYG